MKNTKPKFGLLVAAALLGLGQLASAEGPATEQFYPLEKLAPKDRAFFDQQVRNLERSVRIDWESVIAGVNEKGELILRDRKSIELQSHPEPSCWTSPY